MFKDIKVFKDDKSLKYSYKINDGILLFSINDISGPNECLKIIYDENIYQISLSEDTKNKNLKAGQILVKPDKNAKNLSFSVDINYKFFIKTVYKFLNGIIDKDMLIQEVYMFRDSKAGKKYKNELTKLLEELENENVSLEENDDSDRIIDLLLNNELYLSLAEKMNVQDLMLLVTYYISVPMPSKINQKTFNDMVSCGIKYDHSLESVWRLGVNYDGRGFNYDLLDEFFVNSKDSWYLAEYISAITQVDQEKIVKMVMQTKDKEFIKKLLKDNFIQSHLEGKYREALKSVL